MNENVMVIPAKRSLGNRLRKDKKPKLRVAAYCRVSTETEEQAGSYEMQVEHYTRYIEHNPDWELAGIYADDGISGTSTKKREEFNRMIDDCMAGKIDKVITKSISRFARNTIDCLKYVRMLREKNIEIIFEKENIKTLEASGELLLTIMASLAQQESASISQNTKMGIQFRFQEGKIRVNHKIFLGYTKDTDGNLTIVDAEANVVRRIFREYMQGYTLQEIARGLERDGILTGAKKEKWHIATLQGILRNEKYMGDALLQKTITTDFIEKTRMKNDGSLPQYYVKDCHEAIIPRDIFMAVQEEIKRRRNVTGERGKRRIYTRRYALTNLCVCGICGNVYHRIIWNNHGKKRPVWRCCTRIDGGPEACVASHVEEDVLHQGLVDAINQLVREAGSMKEILLQNIQTILNEKNMEELERVSKELMEKQKELLGKKTNFEECKRLEEEIEILMEEKQKMLIAMTDGESFKKRILEMEVFLEKNNQLTEYDEEMVRCYVKKIKIYEDRFLVSFKAGIEVNVAR